MREPGRQLATAILGAILIAGYLGGAVVIHVIKGDSFAIPVILGAIAWAALWLRDPRLRDLFPIRRGPSSRE